MLKMCLKDIRLMHTYKHGLCVVAIMLFLTNVFAQIPNREKMALVAVYKNTSGAQWTQTWDLSKPVKHWAGVTVKDGHVVGLNLFRNNLKGIIPCDISKLKYLTHLNLAFNQLEGSFPEEITSLQKLKVLNLEMNTLIAPFPRALAI
jgi:hypothetical protein